MTLLLIHFWGLILRLSSAKSMIMITNEPTTSAMSVFLNRERGRERH